MKKKGREEAIDILKKVVNPKNTWTINKFTTELYQILKLVNDLCLTHKQIESRKSRLVGLMTEEREELARLLEEPRFPPQIVIKTEKQDDSTGTIENIPFTSIKTEKNPSTRTPKSSSSRGMTCSKSKNSNPEIGASQIEISTSTQNDQLELSKDDSAEPVIYLDTPQTSTSTSVSTDTRPEDTITENEACEEFMVMEPNVEEDDSAKLMDLDEHERNDDIRNEDDDDDGNNDDNGQADDNDDDDDEDFTINEDEDDVESISESEQPKDGDNRLKRKVKKSYWPNEEKYGQLYRKLPGQNFECFECGEKCSKKKLINAHIKSHAVGHNNICQHCGLSFQNDKILTKHCKMKHLNESTPNHNIDSKFICGGCTRIFTNLFYLKVHRNVEYHKKEYECEYCRECFPSGNKHTKHLESHLYQCIMCQEIFGKKPLLENHMAYTHADEQNLICTVCSRSFQFFSDLCEHYGSHVDPEKAHVCLVCQRRFTSQLLLNDHLHVHSIYKQIQCASCPMRFKTPQAHQKHKDGVHRIVGESKGTCEGCGHVFETKWLLKRHQQIEDDVTMKQCDACRMTFTCCRNLITHKKETHANNTTHKKFVCDLCGKLFVSSGTLKRHVFTHSGLKPHKCDVCGKSYTTAMGRDQHMQSHLNLRRFQCHICSKQFNINVHLKRHMKTHRSQRDFHCNICNKSFTQSGNLKVHQRIHTGVKPYKCQYCGKDFMYSSILNDHVKKHQQNYY